MKYQLIGLRSTDKFFSYENNGDDFDECYDILFKNIETKEKIIVSIGLEIGYCYSGYCGAEWIHTNTKTVENYGPFTHKPKNIVYYDKLNFFSNSSFEDDYFYFNEDDDCYYPSAQINIKFNNFIEGERAKEFTEKDKKTIYVFHGDSATGKSTLAMKAFDNILVIIFLGFRL